MVVIEGLNPATDTSCLYYKPMTSINEDSRVVTKLETSLTDDARVIIYNHHMYIVKATGEISCSTKFLL